MQCWRCQMRIRKLLKYERNRKYFTVIRSKSGNIVENVKKDTELDENDNLRVNALGIQMLSSSIHAQIFGRESLKDENKIKKSINHLKKHNLWGKETSILPAVDLKLPKLLGNNIDEHFRIIAEQQSAVYRKLVDDLIETDILPFPTQWNYQAGWTKYSQDGTMELVDFPEENALVFDVEVCLAEGNFPTLATAVGAESWYSWCSERVIEDRLSCSQRSYINDLISLETKNGKVSPSNKKWEKKIIIGHNISFDRSRIKEQYLIKGPETRFLDTMSLHIATSGLTSYQRSLLMAEKTGSKSKDVQEAKTKSKFNSPKQWMQISSMNNLADVHNLYCPDEPPVQKETRDIFVKGTISDVRNKFQELMLYCANDVKATYSILCKLLPLFYERFPHPVTFAGLLEMSTAYLPVNQNWERYLRDSDDTYNDLEQEMKLSLMHLANEACELHHNERYKEDPWLWDLDWSIKNMRIKKPSTKLTRKAKLNSVNEESSMNDSKSDKSSEIPCINEDDNDEEDIHPNEEIKKLLSTGKNLYKVQPVLPGYPAWYCQLCEKFSSENEDWTTGPNLLSAQTKISPKLLRLTWDGYPLHYDPKHRWGYLVPGKNILNLKNSGFPLRQVLAMCSRGLNENCQKSNTETSNIDLLWEQLESGIGDPVELSALWKEATEGKEFKKKKKKYIEPSGDGSAFHHGNGPYDDVDIPGCWFYRLPHKNGSKYCVGNPLAKDFLSKISDGTLKAWSGAQAEKALKLSKMTSYWRNAQKRIKSQMVVWLKKNELPKTVTKHPDYEDQLYGAILPQIITAGTVTRRAVEPTWLTASNAYSDRVGSELKSMIQTPLGYHFVGADVDSQELWIAAILGDAHFAGFHGCTAFGWMILQGKKSNGTDMHSKTASTIGITRDQAKILNYGRIYGAGQPFAQQLLMQFNHRLKIEEAKEKAEIMYAATKGVRKYILNASGNILYDEVFCCNNDRNQQKMSTSEDKIIMSKFEILQLLQQSGSTLEFQDVIEKPVWSGGTESPMFNKLEEIAQSDEPATPVLGCRISRALEPSFVGNNFMTSRVNWVVQSSAVDYLHLMLICMRWLCDTYEIDARFCISIHDEVRYLVKSEDRYKAALALQITNLLTRSLFAYKLNMNDLPQSVAFFSTVDIDTVLRKEVTMNCMTPSNPHGLHRGYGIPLGEALDIQELLKKTNGQLKKK